MASLFTTQTPTLPNASDGVPYELGMKFAVAKAGQITAIRYYKSSSDGGTHTGKIWQGSTLLASVVFSGGTASGWQEQALPTPLKVNANTTYVVSVNIATNYPFTVGGLSTPIVNGDITGLAGGGVYGTSGTLPSNSFQSSNYFRDIVFVADTVTTAASIEPIIIINGNSFSGSNMAATLMDNQQVTLKLQAKSAAGNVTTMPVGAPVWSSSDTTICTVQPNADGSEQVICTGKLGTAKITATVGSLSTSLDVTVTAGPATSLSIVVGIPTP